MALKSLSVLFTIVSISVASVSHEASAALGGSPGGIVGGWRPIQNPNDPLVVEIAKFAVSEHNKLAKSSLVYVAVVKAESQVVSGTNYRLVISATDGDAGKPNNYQAIVWDKPWQKFRNLTSFEEITG